MKEGGIDCDDRLNDWTKMSKRENMSARVRIQVRVRVGAKVQDRRDKTEPAHFGHRIQKKAHDVHTFYTCVYIRRFYANRQFSGTQN